MCLMFNQQCASSAWQVNQLDWIQPWILRCGHPQRDILEEPQGDYGWWATVWFSYKILTSCCFPFPSFAVNVVHKPCYHQSWTYTIQSHKGKHEIQRVQVQDGKRHIEWEGRTLSEGGRRSVTSPPPRWLCAEQFPVSEHVDLVSTKSMIFPLAFFSFNCYHASLSTDIKTSLYNSLGVRARMRGYIMPCNLSENLSILLLEKPSSEYSTHRRLVPALTSRSKCITALAKIDLFSSKHAEPFHLYFMIFLPLWPFLFLSLDGTHYDSGWQPVHPSTPFPHLSSSSADPLDVI